MPRFQRREESASAVTLDGITFEGRALLVRRLPKLKIMAVAPVRILVDGAEVAPENR